MRPWMTCPLDDASLDDVPLDDASLDDVSLGRCVPWSTCPDPLGQPGLMLVTWEGLDSTLFF